MIFSIILEFCGFLGIWLKIMGLFWLVLSCFAPFYSVLTEFDSVFCRFENFVFEFLYSGIGRCCESIVAILGDDTGQYFVMKLVLRLAMMLVLKLLVGDGFLYRNA